MIEERTPNFVRTHALLRQGDVASEIILASREQGTDLIVMNSIGVGGSHSDSLGSIASKVLKNSACPVLIINRGEVLGNNLSTQNNHQSGLPFIYRSESKVGLINSIAPFTVSESSR